LSLFTTRDDRTFPRRQTQARAVGSACTTKLKELQMTAATERPMVYTVSETAAMLGISRSHAYDLVTEGQLPHLRLGRRIVVPRHAIEALLAPVTPRVQSP
jgi:excisionase family DNA binding protein